MDTCECFFSASCFFGVFNPVPCSFDPIMCRWTPLQWLYSLLSGPSLLTLHELYACPRDSRWLGVAVLLCAGLASSVLTRLCPSLGPWRGGLCYCVWEPWAELLSLGVQSVGNAALLLRKGMMIDVDVGAVLMIIPLGTLMSMQWGCHPSYELSAKVVVGGLTIGVFVYTTAAVSAGLGSVDADDVDNSFSWVLLATNALFSFNESSLPSGGVAVQAGIWAALLFWQGFYEMLLVSVHPLGLFVFHGTLLALVCVSLSGRVYHVLCFVQVKQPKRALLLFNACVLSIAYNFHWRHPHQIALAAIAVMLVKGVAICWQLWRQ